MSNTLSTQYNIELRKLADLKVNDKIKSTFEVMKSKRIKPDATTIEILARYVLHRALHAMTS